MMSEQFILFGKKKKEYFKVRKEEDRLADLERKSKESKQYLERMQKEDTLKRDIQKAKAERFKRSSIGKIATFFDDAASGRGEVSMGKKKKKRKGGYGIKRSGGGDAFFGGGDMFRF